MSTILVKILNDEDGERRQRMREIAKEHGTTLHAILRSTALAVEDGSYFKTKAMNPLRHVALLTPEMVADAGPPPAPGEDFVSQELRKVIIPKEDWGVPALRGATPATPHIEHDHYCGECGRAIRVYNDARLNNPCCMRGCKGDVLCRDRG